MTILKMNSVITFLSFFLFLYFSSIGYIYGYEKETSGGDGLKLSINFNQLEESYFHTSTGGVIRLLNIIDPENTYFTDNINISYSGTETVSYSLLQINSGIFPAGFGDSYTQGERENYIIENVCKNSSYNGLLNYVNGSDLTINQSNIEGVVANNNNRGKALVICFKNSSGLKYGAFAMGYRMMSNFAIHTFGQTGLDYNNIHSESNKFRLEFKVNDIDGNDKIFKYYLSDGICSNNYSDYDYGLIFSQLNSENGEPVEPTITSDGIKDLNVCFGVFDGDDNGLIHKIEKKVRFTYDNTIPTISITQGDWDNENWYNVNRNIKIKCTDLRLNSCQVNYGGQMYTGVINGENSEVNLTLSKEGENNLDITSTDLVGNISTISKKFKLDKIPPSAQVYFEEVVNETTRTIDQIKVKVICLDNLSGCKNNDISGWFKDGGAYEKTFTSNGTYQIALTDNLHQTYTQNIVIFNIGKSLANWYGISYSDANYKELDLSGFVTSCGISSSCNRFSPGTTCSIFQANINPVSNNGYDIYTDSGTKFKANHRFASEYAGGMSANKLRCQYYDGIAPNFTPQNKVLLASNSNLKYDFSSNLTESGGSGLKTINIKYTLENGTTQTKTSGNIPSLTIENNYKSGSSFIDLGLNTRNISDYDSTGKGYGRIELDIELEDWAGNKTTKKDYIYIVPGPIDSAISMSFGKDGYEKNGSIIADGKSYYKYTINLKDQFQNKIKNFTINNTGPYGNTVYERIITSDGIAFNNTTSIYDNTSKPIYYKWPGTISYSNASDSFSTSSNKSYLNTQLQNGDSISFNVISVIPTQESLYTFGRGDVFLSSFKINDNKNSSVTFSGDKLKFWPAIEHEITMSSNLNDNTNYEIKITAIRNTENNINNDLQKIFVFNYTNTGGLFKRFQINDDEKYNRTGKVSFYLNYQIPHTIGSKINTYALNIDSNGLGFGDVKLEYFLDYDKTYLTAIQTSYQTLRKVFTPDAFSSRTIDIKGSRVGNQNSLGNQLEKDKVGRFVIDQKGFEKSELKKEIKSNVYKYTKNITNKVLSNTNYTVDFSNPSVTLPSGEKIFYYDFTGKECANSYNTINKGCLVKITGDIIGINGKNNIIVKGGNLVIDSDMYYNDNKSMIGYFILRDDKNIKKGGNIYITQKPTNIHGVAYAEGSLISVDASDPTKMFTNTNTGMNDLNKQLLWFGSIFSANTIGGSTNVTNTTDKKLACPYGTDIYVDKKGNLTHSCTANEANKYDLANIRRFESKVGNATVGCPGSYYAINAEGNKINNAFIGRKSCFNDTGNTNLLKIDNHSSTFVVKYDSKIQSNPLIILTK